MSQLNILANRIKEKEENIRQNYNNLKNIDYCMSNSIFIDVINHDKSKYMTLGDVDIDNVCIDYRKHDLYKYLESNYGGEYSDYIIEVKLKRFMYDLSIYSGKTMFNKCKGDLHCITGNDGDLQYVFICSECGTIIIDDHSDSYQYNCPSFLCPVCNELKEDNQYPFKYYTRESPQWTSLVYFYSGLVKKQLLTEKELDDVILTFKYFSKDRSWLYKKFMFYKIKSEFKRDIKKRFKEMDYIAGTDMKNIKLKYIKQGELK